MSDYFKMEGILKVIRPTAQVTEKFTKREFVLNIPHDQYPQDIAFQLTQKNVDQLDDMSEGDSVEVSFRIRGREYEGRYFNNLEAWRVVRMSASAEPIVTEVANDEEDLPF